MSMRGFEEPNQPILLRVTAAGLPVTEVTVDPALMEATAYGILALVAGVKYFVPWQKVEYIKQVQPVAPPVTQPTQGSTAPVPPPVVRD